MFSLNGGRLVSVPGTSENFEKRGSRLSKVHYFADYVSVATSTKYRLVFSNGFSGVAPQRRRTRARHESPSPRLSPCGVCPRLSATNERGERRTRYLRSMRRMSRAGAMRSCPEHHKEEVQHRLSSWRGLIDTSSQLWQLRVDVSGLGGRRGIVERSGIVERAGRMGKLEFGRTRSRDTSRK